MVPVNNAIKNLCNTNAVILWELPQGVYEGDSRVLFEAKRGGVCALNVFQYILHGAEPITDGVLVELGRAVTALRKQLAESRAVTFGDFTSTSEKEWKVSVYLKFFKELNTSVSKQVHEAIIELYTFNAQGKIANFDDASLDVRVALVSLAARQHLAKAYGLKRAAWNPMKGIDALFEEVKAHGVIGFSGEFGNTFYKVAPHAVYKIQGREVYGWSQGERREGLPVMLHYIAVVGVRKSKENPQTGQVIYVDLEDGTDPHNPSRQKFYVVSYETFKKHLVDEYAIAFDSKRFLGLEEGFFLQGIPYAFGLLPNPPYVKRQ